MWSGIQDAIAFDYPQFSALHSSGRVLGLMLTFHFHPQPHNTTTLHGWKPNMHAAVFLHWYYGVVRGHARPNPNFMSYSTHDIC